MLIKIKYYLQNIVIALIFITGAFHIVSILPLRPREFIDRLRFVQLINADAILVFHGISALMAGLMIMFLSRYLYKRMHIAYVCVMILLPISLVLQIQWNNRALFSYYTLINLLMYVFLLCTYKDFNKASNPVTIKFGALFLLFSLITITITTSVGFLIERHQYSNIVSFEDAFSKAINWYFTADKTAITAKTKFGIFYRDVSFAVFWGSAAFSLILFFTPIIYYPVATRYDRYKARQIINQFSQNPLSYVCLEDDKKYFFSSGVKGVTAFTFVNNVVVCAGDPICAPEDMGIFLSEFIRYCKNNDLELVFVETTDAFLDVYRSLGFNAIKYGEEAMFYLPEYNLKGRKKVNIRNAIHKADEAGIEVFEYKPSQSRDSHLERQIEEVSAGWLADKKGSELSFMIGTVGLKNPMDKRYFVARDPAGIVQGFIVFYPYQQNKGYYADITRRRKTAPNGVMEKLLTTAFAQMNDEGVLWCSMGLAPLANVVSTEGRNGIYETIFNFVYENMNSLYNFKSLHHYKAKYVPTHWHTCYLVSYKQFTPKIAYAIVMAQSPKALSDYLMVQWKQIFSSKQQKPNENE